MKAKNREKYLRKKADDAVKERDAFSDSIFAEGREPTAEEWRKIEQLNQIHRNCHQLLAKFFTPDEPPPVREYQFKLH